MRTYIYKPHPRTPEYYSWWVKNDETGKQISGKSKGLKQARIDRDKAKEAIR